MTKFPRYSKSSDRQRHVMVFSATSLMIKKNLFHPCQKPWFLVTEAMIAGRRTTSQAVREKPDGSALRAQIPQVKHAR